MHELSGEMLLYVLQNQRAPASLDELVAASDNPNLSMTCPVSQQAYVYRNPPIELSEQGLYVLLHDPQPSHDHRRWGVTFRPATMDQVAATDVRLFNEQFFLANP